MDEEHVKARNELKKWMQVREMAEAGVKHVEFRVAWVRDQMERILRENVDALGKKVRDSSSISICSRTCISTCISISISSSSSSISIISISIISTISMT